MKRLLCMLLSCSIVFLSAMGFSTKAEAAEASEGNVDITYRTGLVNSTVEYFVDENGKEYSVITEKYMTMPIGEAGVEYPDYVLNDPVEELNEPVIGVTPRGLFPEYDMGEIRIFCEKYSNEELGAYGDIGGYISDATKAYIVDNMAESMAKTIGSRFLSGFAIASGLMSAFAQLNVMFGNNGVEIYAVTTYGRTYINGGGYYMYGWELTTFDAYPY